MSRIITDADVAKIKQVARSHPEIRVEPWLAKRGTWYILANPLCQDAGTAIDDATHLMVVCHPEDERQLRDLIALAQEHAP